MAKILVVDDDPRNLRLAVTVLEQAGHEVLSAQGGAEGVEAALAHAPDLVLMDMQMPGMDGIAALKCLRAEPLAGFAHALPCARGPKLSRREFLRARDTFPISGVWHAK